MKRVLTRRRKVGRRTVMSKTPFYYDRFYSTAVLGTKSSFIFFAKSEDVNERNYEGEVNPSPTGSMRIISLSGKLIGPNNKPISIDVLNIAALEEISQLINSGLIEVKVGGDTVHKDTLETIVPDLSAVILKGVDDATTTGTNEGRFISAVIPGHHQSHWIKRSDQLIIPFEAPLPVVEGNNFRIEWTSKGYEPGGNLTGYKLRLFTNVEIHTGSSTVARK